MKRFVCLGIIALAATFSLQAQVQVTAELEKTNILIGDQVNLKISLGVPPGVVIQNLDYRPLSEVEKLEVVKIEPADSLQLSDESWLFTQQLVLTSFDSGYYFIPPVTVHFLRNNTADSATSPQLALMVNTIPEVSDTTELSPIKNIISEPLKFSDVLPWILAILALIGLIAWILYLRKRKKPQQAEAPKPIPVLPPHQVALEQLQALQQQQLWQKGEIKNYHSQLSYIIRTYLEGRFSMPALESTTPEILHTLGQMDDIQTDNLHALQRLLETSDLVKFAKAIPSPDIHEKLFELAVAFVQQTQPNIAGQQETNDTTTS